MIAVSVRVHMHVCMCAISFHTADVIQAVPPGLGKLTVSKQSVLEGNTVDVVPTGHQPHHGVITTNL